MKHPFLLNRLVGRPVVACNRKYVTSPRGKLLSAIAVCLIPLSLSLTSCSSGAGDATELLNGFVNPPQEALPRVWWHWMNGNISKEGIKKDLLWMHSSGIGGAHCFDAGLQTPQIVDHRITYMTPEWKDAFAYAVHLTDSLGMELTIPSSPGWSATGGPWVEPADAMKKFTWSEMRLEGGQTFSGSLPEACDATGNFRNFPPTSSSSFGSEGGKPVPTYYNDIAVVAIRLPEADRSMQELGARVTSNGGQFTVDQLTDGDLCVAAQLPADRVKGYSWIQYEFPQPQTIKALTLVDGNQRSEFDIQPAGSKHSLWASQDGRNFTKVADIPIGGVAQQTFDIPVTTARYFQVRFANPDSAGEYAAYAAMFGISFPLPTSSPVYELVLHPVTRINHAEEKAAFMAAFDLALNPTPEADPSEVVALTDVIDLTDKVDEGGILTWDVPQGRWKVYRFGYSLIGKENHPASPEATGLEVDKMDPDAYARYIRHYFDMYKDASEGLMGQHGVQYVLTDSYEAGSATWTPKLREEFQARRGYDLLPWLPVLTGQIVGSTEQSERFLFDWRKTLGDLLAENYDQLGQIAKEEYGMKGRYSEAHENGRLYMVDGMEVKRDADVAMAAIWVPDKISSGSSLPMAQADIRESASAAHVYGGKLVAAESMTSIGFGGQAWSYCPESLKPIVDTEFYSGVNRVVVHTSVHQPSDDHIPGLGLMIFGQWFNRHETWAGQAKAWTTYLARNSYMMQQGQYVADVAYYYGEDNNITSLFGAQLPDVPYGYSYDFINSDALTRLLTVKKGSLILPSGMSYQILALDDNAKTMSLPVLRKLAQLADAGAIICGAIPEHIGGLGDAEEFQQLVDQVWHSGKKNVLGGQTVAQALNAQGIAPDFTHTASASDSIRYVHRALKDGVEFYWVNNVNDKPAQFTASLRSSGGKPQLWHPETGEVEELSYAIVDGRTEVQLDLVNRDAVFIVLSGKADAAGVTLPSKEQTQLLTVSGPWQVSFQEHRGAPASATYEQLASLAESADPGIKYFSGTATYTNTLTVDETTLQAGGKLLLDLGRVGNIAEVIVGGQLVATLWKAPFVADITSALQPGENSLEVRVTNLWSNRLIGDAQPGVKTKLTYTTMPFYSPNDPLRPSGLMGPVTLSQVK